MGIRGRDKAKKCKKLLDLITFFWAIFPRKFRLSLYACFRETSGSLGLAIRYTLIRTLAASIGENVAIFPSVHITKFEYLKIGDNVSIQPMTYIDGFGGVNIGNNVSIAHMVTIMSTEHIFDNLDIPIKDQGHVVKPVVIEDNVWIGSKASILKGVKIRSGCIVAASAVVTKSIQEENAIYAGCPAKLLRYRGANKAYNAFPE